ncbi:crustapain-like [Hermetia illucens]|uniref:crustapain-like n=1 Tax=Hermetia illucens TaxID=343691 RepID=UPI0018CC65ED|nr:crustapain-like [Hermetia illucens]
MITHLIIYFLFSIVTLTSGDVEKLDADLEWEAFKAKFNKFYPSLDEEIFRKAVFKDNLNFINYHNQMYDEGEVPFALGVNQYTDLTKDEYIQNVLSHSDLDKRIGSYAWLRPRMIRSKS